MLFTSFKIWNILDKIFVPIRVQLHALSAIQQLQRYAIVFRDALASNRISAVEEATYNPLICYENFLGTKKQPVIFGGMVGMSSRQPYALQGSGSIWPWPLQPGLEGAPIDAIHHSEIGTKHAMTEVMDHIQVLLNSTGRSE